MASNLILSLVAGNAACSALAVLANGGFIDVYATTQPVNPETSPGGTSLVTLTLPNPAFGAPVAGVGTANTIAAQSIANTGTALWFRVTEANHTTPVFDGSVGISSGYDMNCNAVSLVSGAQFQVTSLTLTVPAL